MGKTPSKKYACTKRSVSIIFSSRWSHLHLRLYASVFCTMYYVCPLLLSVRPKPSFGIGNRNQGPISVSETFFFKF